MTYEKFEHQAIRALLEGNDPYFERLYDQFLEAEILNREETEIGFVVNFEVPKHLAINNITRKISDVSVMLVGEEVLRLELIVSAGLITQLNAVYLLKTKYSKLVFQLNDLVFSRTSKAPSADVEIEVESTKGDQTALELEGKSDLELSKLAHATELARKIETLSAENARIKKLLEQEQTKNLELVEKTDQLTFESTETQGSLFQEQALSLEMTEKSEQLLSENTQIKELLAQEQTLSLELAEKNEQLLSENTETKELLAQAQGQESELAEKSEQLLSESAQVKVLLEQEQALNLELTEKAEKLLSENTQVKELLEQEQEKIRDLALAGQLTFENSQAQDLFEQEQARNSKLTELLEQEKVRSSELLEKTEQLLSEKHQTEELLEQEQAINAENLGKSAQLLAENAQIKETLEQEQAKNAELLGKSTQLLTESVRAEKSLSEKQLRNSELLEKTEQLYFENSHILELIEREKARNVELMETSEQLLSESPQINEMLMQGEQKNLELTATVEAFKKSLEQFKFEPEPKISELKTTEITLLDEDSQTITDETPDHKGDAHEKEDHLVESQRKKETTPFNEIADKFLTKTLSKEQDRTKAKYHIAVWKLAFTIGINVLFYLFFAMSLVIILLSGVQGESGEPRSVMGFSALRVVSESMEPNLPMNSLIIIRQGNPNDLERGQIATYLRDGNLITHRIHRVERDNQGNSTGFILRGDANFYLSNRVVPSENIVGHVVFSSYAIGRLLVFFGTNFVLMLTITVSLLIILYIVKQVVVQKLTAEPRAKREDNFEEEVDFDEEIDFEEALDFDEFAADNDEGVNNDLALEDTEEVDFEEKGEVAEAHKE